MSNTPGVADHAAQTTSFGGKVKKFFGYAKKAVYAFLISGVAGGLAPALQNFDFSNLTWGNLWAGLGSGLVGSVVVYVARNKAGSVGLPPELEAALESIVVKHLGTFERNLAPKVLVRADDGKLRKTPAATGEAEPYVVGGAPPAQTE